MNGILVVSRATIVCDAVFLEREKKNKKFKIDTLY